MKRFHHLLLLFVIGSVSFGQESSNVTPVVSTSQSATQEVSRLPTSVHPLGQVSDTARQAMAAARAKQPLCILTITNDVSQNSILTITDDVNGYHGIDRYVDGFCGTGGALLCREYVGHGFLVTVAFAWDQSPKKTIVSLYGTNVVAGKIWKQDMTKALREKLSGGSPVPKAQK